MEIVLASCVDTVYIYISLKFASLCVMKLINENIYLHGRVKISSLLNISLKELQDLTPIVLGMLLGLDKRQKQT
jgi:hypothetical protein